MFTIKRIKKVQIWILIICLISILSFNIFATPSNVVAFWDFNQTTTPFISSVNGVSGYKLHWNNGISYENIYPTYNTTGSGISQSLNTDNDDNDYSINNQILLNESMKLNTSVFTWVLWVKQDQSSSGSYTIVDTDLKTAVRLDNSQLQAWVFGGSSVSSIQGITNGVWYFLGIKSTGSEVYLIRSSAGVLYNTSLPVGSDSMGDGLTVGGRITTLHGLNGNVDSLFIFNTSLSWSDLKSLYNNGNIPPEDLTSNIDLLFSNESNPNTYKTVFDEGEDFFISINWTYANNNTPIDSNKGTCNNTLYNAYTENNTILTNNITICNTGCDYLSYREEFKLYSHSNPVNDTVFVSLCNENLIQGNTLINISCSLGYDSIIIPSLGIPLCSIGSKNVLLSSNVCVTKDKINVSVKSDVTYNRRKTLTYIHVDRLHEKIIHQTGTDIFYNFTSKLWETDHPHEYYIHGVKKIESNCSYPTSISYNNNVNEFITIVNRPPFLAFNNIISKLGKIKLINNSVYEFARSDFLFSYTINDDDLSHYRLTISNSSDIIYNIESNIFNQSSINLSFNYFDSRLSNPINLTLWANDTAKNETLLFYSINITDTVNPYCTGFNDVTTFNNTNYNWNISCYDENFFSINLSCTNGIVKYVEGLNIPSYTFSNSTTVMNDINCSYEYCDGHTAQYLIKNWYVRSYPSRIEFEVNKIKHKLQVINYNSTFNYSREKDRINFDMIPYENNIDKIKKNKEIIFYYTVSNKAYYIESDKYNAWIVDSITKTWFDLNNEQKIFKKINVQRWNETTFIITGIIKDNIKTEELTKIKFKSIGELNCISGKQYINIIRVTDNTGFGIFNNGTCPLEETLSFIIGFIAVIIFLIFIMMWNSRTLDIPFINLFIGVCFIGISVSLYNCSILFSVPIFLFGFLVMMTELI